MISIRTIQKHELKAADEFQNDILNPQRKKRYRTYGYVTEQHSRLPELFLGAHNGNKLVGVLFGYVKRNIVLLGEMAVHANYQKQGIGRKLIVELERRVLRLKKRKIVLGAREGTEKFYLKLGYTPLVFVQIRHKKVPSDYLNKGFKIVRETNYKDAKRLTILTSKKVSMALLETIKQKFNAYDVIYLFEKEINR